jgi:glycosyltransferase involved in cell wall biosynthesis
VCHVIGGLGTGGAQRQLLEYLRHASSPRDDVRVLALFDDDARFADRVRETGAAVEVVYERLRRSRWRHLLARAVPHTAVALGLRRRFVELRPRCVVSWLYVADIVTAAAVGRRSPVPLICWVRNLSAWKTWPEYRRWWLQAADRRAARRASLVLANSLAVARDYERWAGLGDGTVDVVVNGVDVARIRDAASPAPDHSFVGAADPLLVTVGRIAREKNLAMLVACCRRLEERGRPANLVIVGHGELESELQEQVDAAGIGHRVAIVGGTDRPEGWMAAADLFVLASRVEGMPNALLEAQALGVPAVTTAAGGAAEVVEDGVTGLVVPVDDEDAIVAAVGRLLDDPETRREMGRRAEDRVAERFGIERFTARLDGLTGRTEERAS